MTKHSLVEKGRHSVKDTRIDSVRNQKQNVISVCNNRFDWLIIGHRLRRLRRNTCRIRRKRRFSLKACFEETRLKFKYVPIKFFIGKKGLYQSPLKEKRPYTRLPRYKTWISNRLQYHQHFRGPLPIWGVEKSQGPHLTDNRRVWLV